MKTTGYVDWRQQQAKQANGESVKLPFGINDPGAKRLFPRQSRRGTTKERNEAWTLNETKSK